MPELTVSMPAYNTAKYIGAAIESVLRQRGVDFELMVVDDASQDDTARVARSFKDPRVRVFVNRVHLGISACHNLVIQRSNAPFIAHVDSDDIVLPHAFRKLVAELASDSTIGQVHCYFLEIDESGKTTGAAVRARRNRLLATRPPGMDYKRELIVRGTVTNHLRTYRREVFQTVGYFNESLGYAEDYEMALRIVDRYKIKLVPEFLYAFRQHGGSTTKRFDLSSVELFCQRIRICRELYRRDKLSYLKSREYNLNKLILLGLWEIVRSAEIRNFLPELAKLLRGPRDPERDQNSGRSSLAAVAGEMPVDPANR
jgi:GT2 family glycosyltransferase